MRVSFIRRALLLFVFVSLPNYSPKAQEQAANEKTPTILFVCEHGAAKSVIAAAYFDKLAKERGLPYRAVFRGTHPDPTLAVAAVKGLQEDGLKTQGWKPQMITKEDMQAAAAIVTLGCALPDKDAVAGKVAEWEGVPSVSENYAAARDHIVKKMRSLVDELAQKETQPKGKKKPPRYRLQEKEF